MKEVTITAGLTEDGFPFLTGRAYRISDARAANLIAGGHAVEGVDEGVHVIELRDASEPTPITTAEEVPAAVVAPETAAPPAPEAPAPEVPADAEGIQGAEALTAKPRRAKLSGTAMVTPKA